MEEMMQVLPVALAVFVLLAAAASLRSRRHCAGNTRRTVPVPATIEVRDPEAARLMIIDHADSFSDHPPFPVDLDAGHPKTSSINSAPYGPLWRVLRCNPWLSAARRRRRLAPASTPAPAPGRPRPRPQPAPAPGDLAIRYMDDTRGRLPVDARGKGADADGAAGGATKKAAVGKRNASTAIDSVWTHGIPFGSGFKCHYCNRAFSGGGATRFKEHLAGIIGNVEACQKVPKDVRKCMEESRTEGKRARAVNKARKKRMDDEIAR
ncbi:uncharacterized protein [Miscanthus floridulus]|uniref:uncharacterized protein n=1 Tax=Miscanthus floridulus TaxID=154761 RepID=UPI003459A4F4